MEGGLDEDEDCIRYYEHLVKTLKTYKERKESFTKKTFEWIHRRILVGSIAVHAGIAGALFWPAAGLLSGAFVTVLLIGSMIDDDDDKAMRFAKSKFEEIEIAKKVQKLVGGDDIEDLNIFLAWRDDWDKVVNLLLQYRKN